MASKYLLLSCLILGACQSLPAVDNYGYSWHKTSESQVSTIQTVNNEVYFATCQQAIDTADQACAVHYPNRCAIYLRADWRYDDKQGIIAHELKHCEGFSHDQLYRVGILDSRDYTTFLRR